MKQKVRLKDIASPADVLCPIDAADLAPVAGLQGQPAGPVRPEWKEPYDFTLDGFSALGLPKPRTQSEETALVEKFLRGLERLFSKENNWTFVMPLTLSTEYCVRCNTCNEACPIYTESGRQDIYRPNYRSEVLRKIYKKYFTPAGRLLGSLVGADVELNWHTIHHLAELSYRCSICRRCAAACPIGVDNGLITRELRKLFSQEFGIAPEGMHRSGTMRHLAAGSSTGMSPAAFRDAIEFIETDIEERIGRRIKIPVDKQGADILLIHNAGEYVAWPENPAAFAILFDAAGLDWTLSSEIYGYEGVNYGAWYDDIQCARIAVRQVRAAKKLGVRKIVVGECGHATKALVEIADRVCTGELAIPRESCLPILEQIAAGGGVRFDPGKNNFPVTLHDPCNLVRLMGIVNPQRNILQRILPPGRLREMPDAGLMNYCCGGGSGFAVMNSWNFPEWRNSIACRRKAGQVLEAFAGCLDPAIPKYYCAPCSNCKGAARDALMEYYGFRAKYNIIYGGLAELMVNAMADLPGPFITWEEAF